MKKDIRFPEVIGVKVVITCKTNELDQDQWDVYVLNENPFDIENVIVVSQGYSEKGQEQQRTSVLRQLLGPVPAGTAALVEPINPELFHLFNEFWVSYYVGKEIYDKKFIFVPETITKKNLRYLPQIDLNGVLHE
jgi:hypothetical protein